MYSPLKFNEKQKEAFNSPSILEKIREVEIIQILLLVVGMASNFGHRSPSHRNKNFGYGRRLWPNLGHNLDLLRRSILQRKMRF